MLRTIVVIAGLIAWPSVTFAQALACTGHLVTVSADGAATTGSKDALRQAVHRGDAIRVGWSIDGNQDGKPDLTHWTEAGFLTDWQSEIFTQIADIQRQSPRTDLVRIDMPAVAQRWTGLLGTNGTLVSHFSDGAAAPPVRVSSTWCLASCRPPEWRLVYRHDADGKPLAGEKPALFDAVRRGYPIRLAWGSSLPAAPGAAASVEHVADPVFVTIASGVELIAQLPEHIAQASYSEPTSPKFDDAAVMWRGMMGTDGSFDAVWVNRATGQEVRRVPQRAAIAWFALAPDPACAPAPLDLATPGGVRRAP